MWRVGWGGGHYWSVFSGLMYSSDQVTKKANTTGSGFEIGCTWSGMHVMSNSFLMMKNPNIIDKIQTENLRVKNPNSLDKIQLWQQCKCDRYRLGGGVLFLGGGGGREAY